MTTRMYNADATIEMDKFTRFENWLRENGAIFDQLELRSYECDTPQQIFASSAPTNGMMLDDAAEEKKEPNSNFVSHPGQFNAPNALESEMRGVHAISNIPPNSVCMSIPRRCLITVEMGQATEIGQAVLNSDLDLDAPKHIFLMIYVLWDRKVNGASSFFHPYYEILPQTLHNMPIFWTDAELAELHGSYLLHQIADRNQAIAEDYHAILSVAPGLEQICTLDEFKWARMCVCSRNFGLQIDGHRTSALVPHADMLNHYRPRETKWTFDEERQAFTITTLQYISAGCEVLDSYGQKCNHRFLLNYGFAVEDNRELDGFCPNEVPIELMVPTSDPCYQEKLDFWMRGEHHAQSISPPLAAHQPPGASTQPDDSMRTVKRVRVCVSNNENTRLLFSLLRTLACTPEEIRAVSEPSQLHHSVLAPGVATTGRGAMFGMPDTTTRHYPYPTGGSSLHTPKVVLTGIPSPIGATYYRSCRDVRHPLSLRNEQDVMRILLHTVQTLLSQYPTTIQEDIEALENETAYPKFSNQRHARIQVRGEKQVLHHFAAWATTALQVLDVIEVELQEEAQHGGGTCALSGDIEVRWRGHHYHNPTSTGNGRRVVPHGTHDHRHGNFVTMTETQPNFDLMIRRIEEDMDDEGAVHHTILRYCADVLGSLRREEFRNLRRRVQRQRSGNSNSHAVAGHSFAHGHGRKSGGSGADHSRGYT